MSGSTRALEGTGAVLHLASERVSVPIVKGRRPVLPVVIAEDCPIKAK